MGTSDGPTTSIGAFVDGFDPWDGPLSGVTGGDPLGWPGYAGVLGAARERSGAVESVLTGAATVHGARAAGGGAVRADRVAVIAGVFDFVGGSLGLAAGERIVRAYDRARREELPVLVLARSGGARMQEGMVALVQMARTAAAARRHAEAGLVQVAWLDSPTTGGVYASFASLADVLWAPPGAVVGFAGPRVVEQTTGEALPDGAHTAESAAAAGIIDAVLEPAAARAALATLLRVAAGGREGPRGRTGAGAGTGGTGAGVGSGPGAPDGSRAPAPGPGTAPDAWAEVQRARDPHRPSGRAWLEALVPERVALSGDRAGGVDPVVACGLGTTRGGTAVAYVALDRHTLDGRPRPAGYRTARRAVGLAARLGLPVLTLVDTPGADPHDASERAGVAGEIARTFAALGAHPAPTVSLVVGEGGSGGALAFAATDRCYLLDGAVFSVIGPEGAAAILDRDARRAPEVAPRLRLTGPDLVELGVVDAVLPGALPAGLPSGASGSPSRDAGTGPSAVVDAIEGALANARPGDGLARLDSATRRWLNEAP